MITPNKELLDRTLKIPTITIAGQEWPIPKFAPKQNEVIVPIVLELSTDLVRSMSLPKERRLLELAKVLTGPNYRKLNDVIFLAIQRGHPALLREEYDAEWEVGTMEMIEAFTVIAQQTGLIKFVPAGQEAAKAGEGKAAAANSQTGTQ